MVTAYKNLVIADDDEDAIQLFREAVEAACSDVNLAVVKDGVELLNLLHKISKPVVILLDLNMPLISGKECLQLIRLKDKFDDVPIIILSTSSLKADIDFCLQNGASLYFVKPHSFDDLKLLVKAICTGDTYKHLKNFTAP